MADSFEKLQKTIKEELATQRQTQPRESHIALAKKFGLFIQTALDSLGKSEEDFMRALQIERDLASAILNGTIPESAIDDFLIEDVAEFIKLHPNNLRLILGRNIRPTQDESQSSSYSEHA